MNPDMMETAESKNGCSVTHAADAVMAHDWGRDGTRNYA